MMYLNEIYILKLESQKNLTLSLVYVLKPKPRVLVRVNICVLQKYTCYGCRFSLTYLETL